MVYGGGDVIHMQAAWSPVSVVPVRPLQRSKKVWWCTMVYGGGDVIHMQATWSPVSVVPVRPPKPNQYMQVRMDGVCCGVWWCMWHITVLTKP